MGVGEARGIGADGTECQLQWRIFELPTNWSLNSRGSLWHGAESWNWAAPYKASEKKSTPLLLTFFSLPSDFRCSTPSCLSDWALQHQPHSFPWGSGPIFSVSPQLSSLSYFPALNSSDGIFPIAMFPFQTTVISFTHQTRKSGSPKEHPYMSVSVFLDSWKMNVSPEHKNDMAGREQYLELKNWDSRSTPPLAQLCQVQHSQLQLRTLWSGQSLCSDVRSRFESGYYIDWGWGSCWSLAPGSLGLLTILKSMGQSCIIKKHSPQKVNSGPTEKY